MIDINNLLTNKKIEITEYKYIVKKIKDCNTYFLLYLDNDEKLKIGLDTYIKYSNLKGIDEETYSLFKKEDKYISAYNSCLRKLSIKDYSEKQLFDFLARKLELDSKLIEQIIINLKKYNLIDDNRYCVNRLNYLNKANYSYKSIRNKLLKDGISEDIVDAHMHLDKDAEFDKALQLANKYSLTIKNKSSYAKKQCIINKLIVNGYNYDIVNDVIDIVDLKTNNEDELLEKEYSKAYIKYSKKFEDYDLYKHIMNSLLSKGFKMDDIKKIMEVQNAS